ncbi:class I SAM-dependent methyltransferase [Actinomadura hibisca]|uniref:class I SAM-dependent methyltransferase n=1 Tax=Actinomadura hibisca TaxID=68565 RepID=UPI00082AED92|nr:class I SAM-dependent methyltransferase [Actinomadura hibisca]
MDVGTTGKISLDHIYSQPDPRSYFGTLRPLEYQIPQLAKPHFAALAREYRESRPVSQHTVLDTNVSDTTVLDIGCSYGINAALARCDATMDELYERYAGPDAARRDRAALLAHDREMVAARDGGGVRFVGLDASGDALAYALAAGFLDDAVHADLESADPTEEQRRRLAADLVVSTGCLGYVTHRTIARVLEANAEAGRRPWMAHFVLRMFPFDPVEDLLDAAGYRTERSELLFKQRRFATGEEQALVLDTLSDLGVDPGGLETDGWFYARLYLSRPRNRPERGTH